MFIKPVENLERKFPPLLELTSLHMKFLLTAQVLDAAHSITANIAEGSGRFHYQDNIRFCRISRGSLNETLEHLICAFDDNYITQELLKELKEL